ncbi:hypothetical protein V2G26_008666 [Clonostachys chloroleuca]
MASRSFSKSMRSPLARQLAAPRVQQRTFIAARNLIRAGAARAAPVTAPAQQQVRGVKTIDFAGVKEDVYERADWPQEKLLDYSRMTPLPSLDTVPRATARV